MFDVRRKDDVVGCYAAVLKCLVPMDELTIAEEVSALLALLLLLLNASVEKERGKQIQIFFWRPIRTTPLLLPAKKGLVLLI